MNSESERSKPLTKEETKVLLDLIAGSKIINNKTTNATNNKLKTQEWVRLTEAFNATATCRRQPPQLRLKWENLKKNSRKRSTKIRMNNIQTGGGVPEYIPPDDILDRVASLIGSTASGYSVPFGGDREPETLFVVSGGSGEGSSSGDGSVGEVVHVVMEDNMAGPSIQAIQNNIVVTECEAPVSIKSPNTPKFRFDTPTKNAFRKRRKVVDGDQSRTARNNALAEYYADKKKRLDVQLNNENLKLNNENLKLNNENLKLTNENLKLQNENLKLQNDKLKLELEKLKSPQL